MAAENAPQMAPNVLFMTYAKLRKDLSALSHAQSHSATEEPQEQAFTPSSSHNPSLQVVSLPLLC